MNGRVTAIGLSIFITVFALAVINHYYVYGETSYPINVIRSELALSLETHGIEERVKYLDRTHSLLANYHGNSEWWYPTERTNIDLTKELIADISRDVHNQLGVKERENYFFIPHNELVKYLNSETRNIDSRLDAYGHSAYWNPESNLQWYFFAPIGIISFITFITGILMYGREDDD